MLSMRRNLVMAALLAGFLVGASTGLAVEVKHAGKLQVPPNAALVAFSTDPTIQQVLTQDLQAANRNFTADSHSVLTLTVTVADRALQPGVSLGQLAPGDPDVVDLLKAVGVTPPPIGDTGTERDEAAIARRNDLSPLPQDGSLLQRSMGQLRAERGLLPQGIVGQPYPPPAQPYPQGAAPSPRPQPGSADYTGDTQDYLQQGYGQMPRTHRDDASAYDTVIVARASLNGRPEELTVVAVVHPGEDARDAKKLVAEEIVNALLH
jgi:hypothetical protein